MPDLGYHVRVLPRPHFEGEEARVRVADDGPFGIEMISLQVLREKRRWWGGIRPTWVTLYSCFLDANEGMDEGYTLEEWIEATALSIEAYLRKQRAQEKAREDFYGAAH